MIVQLTHGATGILIHVQDTDGSQPQINLMQEARDTTPSPVVRSGSGITRPLTLAAVGVVCAFLGYRFAPGRGDHALYASASEKVAPVPSPRSSAHETAQIPASLQRQLASRPVVTPTAPASAGAGAGGTGGNPFGLD